MIKPPQQQRQCERCGPNRGQLKAQRPICAVEGELKQATDDSSRVTILNEAIGKAMERDRTIEDFTNGHFALGYLRSWVIRLLNNNNKKKEANHEDKEI